MTWGGCARIGPARPGRSVVTVVVWASAMAAGPLSGQAAAGPQDSARVAVDSTGAPVAIDSVGGSAPATVEAVAQRYVDLNRAGQLAEAAELLAPDVFVIDPTADAFEGPLAAGIEGRDAVAALQRSRGIRALEMDVTRSFVSGPYAVLYGRLTSDYEGGARTGPMPYASILRIEDGLIRERVDYGDPVGYTDRLRRGEPGAGGRIMARMARDYMAAYSERRFEDWRSLYGPGPVYQDPTLELLGDRAGAPRLGADAIIGWFEASFARVQEFEIRTEDGFQTPSHAVFLSTARAVVGDSLAPGEEADGEELRVPFVTVLQFEDGRIVGHRDYRDAAAWAPALAGGDAGPGG